MVGQRRDSEGKLFNREDGMMRVWWTLVWYAVMVVVLSGQARAEEQRRKRAAKDRKGS